MSRKPIRYADAGVDRARASAVKKSIARLARQTFTRGVLSDIGRFGAFFELDRGRGRRPVLVASADGVGTKIKVAALAGRHTGIGIDIVHHCVNDIAVHGARPLFFLDYIASSLLDPRVVRQVATGMSRACRALGVALVGGETAELPGLYAPGDYDLVGFVVGAVERNRILDGGRVRPGDVLLGLPSDGLHTNGYSLARKLLFEVGRLEVGSYVPVLKSTVGAALLKPHRSYYPVMKPLLEKRWISAAAHITGGGLTDNVPRALPPGCAAEIRLGAWPVPPLFKLLEKLGNLAADEMLRTFNLGIGMVLMVPPSRLSDVKRALGRQRARFFEIGRVVRGRRSLGASVRYRGRLR